MAKFKFYQDEKITIWERSTFEVDAETLEDAKELVKKTFEETYCEDAIECGCLVDTEVLFETTERMSVNDNGGFSTIEVLCAKDGDCVPFLHNGL